MPSIATRGALSAKGYGFGMGGVSLPAIGSAYGGGFFAGQISTAGNGIANYNLVVGPVTSAQSSSKQWKLVSTSTAGTTSFIDGPANSAAMNDATHPAAQFCKAVNVGGKTDWYMPAENELEVCYYNLKPTTTSNSTFYGINTNAVPARPSNYTAGNPAQTTAAAFKSGGAEAFFGNNFYWSSTQSTPYAGYAWRIYFSYGYTNPVNKTGSFPVRAIRRVAV